MEEDRIAASPASFTTSTGTLPGVSWSSRRGVEYMLCGGVRTRPLRFYFMTESDLQADLIIYDATPWVNR